MLFRPSIRRCRYVLVGLLGLAAGALRATDAAWPLPAPTLRHLQTLTDNTGLHEFAHGTLPWHENGYCAEDVARALVAVTLYEQWFLGNNRAHLPLYDPQSGGGHDGLSATGVSENEGGESTVMYVIARCVVEETK